MTNPETKQDKNVEEVDPADWTLESDPEINVSMTKIIIRNVFDLNENGLKALCRHYGTVTNAFKINPSTAFVEFAQENEATIAVQQLNSKLGFRFQADFARPKETPVVISSKAANATTLETPDESWEEASRKRRFNLAFSIPLPIRFPKRNALITRSDYLPPSDANVKLRQTDPACFFSISENSETCVEEREQATEKEALAIKSHNAIYTHHGLEETERGRFGPVKRCVVCHGYGFAYCDKCSTSYCSTNHQSVHHTEHTIICGGDPSGAIDKDTGCGGKENKTTLSTSGHNSLIRDDLPTKAKVLITAVLSQNCVYVRSADQATNREYLKTIGDMAKAGYLLGARDGLNAEPVEGEIYLAPYAPLGVYGRVLVTDATFNRKRCKCVFIEHGTVQIVPWDALLPLDDAELKYRKVFVYKTLLAGITEEYGTVEQAIAYLNRLKGQTLYMTHQVVDRNMVNIQLRTSREGKSVNETINDKIIVPALLTDSDHEGFIMYKNLTQPAPARGKNIQIFILNKTTIQLDSRVTWIATSDLAYLEDLHNKLQHYGKKVATFQRYMTPRHGELCLVRCWHKWYRAVCHETVGDSKPALFLCDYGNMIIADLTDIRKTPPQFATDVRTHDGIIEGFDEAKAEGVKLDSELLEICVPENESLLADISERDISSGLVKEKITLLRIHEFSSVMELRRINSALNKQKR
ncbi:protein vreteno [Anopheles darlingi]|uniref:protein vreteno n=1 Tax=Anopheles darlingi TaxID=43151 RepID=UPI0021001114|nr:protein vreteno [Anopheles darlingi]